MEADLARSKEEKRDESRARRLALLQPHEAERYRLAFDVMNAAADRADNIYKHKMCNPVYSGRMEDLQIQSSCLRCGARVDVHYNAAAVDDEWSTALAVPCIYEDADLVSPDQAAQNSIEPEE